MKAEDNNQRVWDSRTTSQEIFPIGEREELLKEIKENYINQWVCNGIYRLAEALKAAEKEIEELKKPNDNLIKKISTDFFFHWYNQPGSNTYQGFDKFWKENKEKYFPS